MDENNLKNAGQVIFKFVIDDFGQERLVRQELVEINENQPFIGYIRFKNKDGEIINKQGVAIHEIKKLNSHLSFKITTAAKTKKFIVPIKDIDFLSVTQDNEKFKQRFTIERGKLKSKGGRNESASQ